MYLFLQVLLLLDVFNVLKVVVTSLLITLSVPARLLNVLSVIIKVINDWVLTTACGRLYPLKWVIAI